jgi:hypothetical protein
MRRLGPFRLSPCLQQGAYICRIRDSTAKMSDSKCSPGIWHSIGNFSSYKRLCAILIFEASSPQGVELASHLDATSQGAACIVEASLKGQPERRFQLKCK